jgi:CRISPR/Cas system CMR-associated protein Cmr1 (group 7 of RAMP superfamily)
VGECVSNCSVYIDPSECVDGHCGWKGNACVRNCFKYENIQSCTNVNTKGCFWAEGDTVKDVSGTCLIEVM